MPLYSNIILSLFFSKQASCVCAFVLSLRCSPRAFSSPFAAKRGRRQRRRAHEAHPARRYGTHPPPGPDGRTQPSKRGVGEPCLDKSHGNLALSSGEVAALHGCTRVHVDTFSLCPVLVRRHNSLERNSKFPSPNVYPHRSVSLPTLRTSLSHSRPQLLILPSPCTMVLESTIVCVDNSEYSRNGDFPPSRFVSSALSPAKRWQNDTASSRNARL